MDVPVLVKPEIKPLFSKMSFVKLAKADAGRKMCVQVSNARVCLLFSVPDLGIGVASLSH